MQDNMKQALAIAVREARTELGLSQEKLAETLNLDTREYYGAAEPPVRCGESHLSGLTEPPHFIY